MSLKKYWENNYIRNCSKCDICNWCQNKDEPICNMELKEGDIISFKIINEKAIYENQIVVERLWNGNLSFLDKGEIWGINGIFITDIKIFGHIDI